jgi:predicted Rossmann fold nucleotide-binding protein DprA/Smf involved in DNA uptake
LKGKGSRLFLSFNLYTLHFLLREGNVSEENTQFWLGLTKLEGLGVRGAHRLLEHFGSPQAAYMASLTELESCGIPARVAQSIFAQAGLKEAARDLEA